MKLRDMDSGKILCASGTQGFFGEGYPHHKYLKLLGLLSFDDVTFVSKTVTLLGHKGNMPLKADSTPKALFPDCIKINPLKDTILNAVNLSNLGLGYYLGDGRWQAQEKPFWISVMSIGDTKERRLDEASLISTMLSAYKKDFSAPFGLQINLSCPNHSSLKPSKIIEETAEILSLYSDIGVPLMPKFSIASAPLDAIMELNDNPNCDAICVSNTLPFGWRGIDWNKAWGTTRSPLKHLGGGGLSGRVLAPLVCEYIIRLRERGFKKHINGGGGIFNSRDVIKYYQAGASSIFVGSVAIFQPWEIASIVKTANTLDWEYH